MCINTLHKGDDDDKNNNNKSCNNNRKQKDEKVCNKSSLSTQKHVYWRLYYNPELIKITLGKKLTQMD
jgi:hypothetical protein